MLLKLFALLTTLAAPALDATVTQSICRGRVPCAVRQVLHAGQAGGAHLAVARIALTERDTEETPPPPDMEACAPFEYWLIETPSSGAPQATLLFALCNDGYGASMVGEDSLSVEPNQLIYDQNGGSNWRWSHGYTISLSPRRILTERTTEYFAVSQLSTECSTDYQSWKTDCNWTLPYCDESKVPITGKMRLIPRIDKMPLDSVQLGTCAAQVDSANTTGLVVHGQPGRADDATLKVVMEGETTIWVEVSDDSIVSDTANWIFEDHLELWLGEEPRMDGVFCLEGPGGRVQWGIPLLKNEIHLGYSEKAAKVKPVAPKVTRFPVQSGVMRLKIELASPAPRLTVVYSDSDDGKSQERLIATSAIKMKDPLSLGESRAISEATTPCELVSGQLNRRSTWDGKTPLSERL